MTSDRRAIRGEPSPPLFSGSLFFLRCLLSFAVVRGSMVSSSTGRLPMTLSTIITDLEAEGCTSLSTATVISSKSVTKSERQTLFSNLFAADDRDRAALEENEAENDGMEATAFGKKLGGDDEDGLGIVVANPSARGSGCGAAEVASTVLATHGTVIFVVSRVDLERGEGVFDSLAPAMEKMLSQKTAENDDGDDRNGVSELIVIFQGMSEGQIKEAKAIFVSQSESVLASIPTAPLKDYAAAAKKSLNDVFDTVEYLTSESAVAASSDTDLLNTLTHGRGQILEPADAADSVSSAVALGLIDPLPKWITDVTLTKHDVLALRRLGEVGEDAVKASVETVASCVEESPLLPSFGGLCEATVKSFRLGLEESVGSSLIRASPLARRKISDLTEELLQELSLFHQDQIQRLKEACFDSFKQSLSKLRVGPNLLDDMEDAAVRSCKDFSTRLAGLYPDGASKPSSSPAACFSPPSVPRSRFLQSLRDYNTEKLQSARASGAFKPVPRKGVTLGFHWLLPKPFGNDYRTNPTQVYRGNMIYTPEDKLTEVPKESVAGGRFGDWRDGVVPLPNSGDLMYTPKN